MHSEDTVLEWLIPDGSAQTVINLRNKWQSINKNALDILTSNADACFDASAHFQCALLCMCLHQTPYTKFPSTLIVCSAISVAGHGLFLS